MQSLPRRMTYAERKALDDKAYQEAIKHLDNFDREKAERAAKGEQLDAVSACLKADNYIKSLATKIDYEDKYVKQPYKRKRSV